MIPIKKQKVEGDQPLHCHLWCLCGVMVFIDLSQSSKRHFIAPSFQASFTFPRPRYHFSIAVCLSLRQTINLLVAFTTSVVPLINSACPGSSFRSSRQASRPLAATSRAAATSSPSLDFFPLPTSSPSSLSTCVTFFMGTNVCHGFIQIVLLLVSFFCNYFSFHLLFLDVY